MDTDLTREQRADVTSEGIALAVFNDPNLQPSLSAGCMSAILNDSGYSPQQAVEEYENDPHDFLWTSSAALTVRDLCYHAWDIPVVRVGVTLTSAQGISWGSDAIDTSGLDRARIALLYLAPYDDTVLWQRVARDLMPSPAVLREYAIRTGVIDRGAEA